MFECVQICTVSDTLRSLQRPPLVRSTQCSVRALPCMVCLASGMACPAACDVQSVRVRWGCGLHLGGMGPEARVGVVSPVSSDQNKKGVFGVPLTNTHPFFTNQNPSNCASLQKFQKIQKGPFRSLDCAIIR